MESRVVFSVTASAPACLLLLFSSVRFSSLTADMYEGLLSALRFRCFLCVKQCLRLWVTADGIAESCAGMHTCKVDFAPSEGRI